jgi:Zn-dependent M28 family amino/carboxypeptidase
LLDRVEDAGAEFTSLFFRRNLSPFGSDHIPFLNAGVPALLAIEAHDANNPVYHSSSDGLPELSEALTSEIAKLMVAVVGRELGLQDD